MTDWGKLQTLEKAMQNIEIALKTTPRVIQPCDVAKNQRTISVSDQTAKDWARQIRAFRRETMEGMV